MFCAPSRKLQEFFKALFLLVIKAVTMLETLFFTFSRYLWIIKVIFCVLCMSEARTNYPLSVEGLQLQWFVNCNHLELVMVAWLSPHDFISYLGFKHILHEIGHLSCWETTAVNFNGDWGSMPMIRSFHIEVHSLFPKYW